MIQVADIMTHRADIDGIVVDATADLLAEWRTFDLDDAARTQTQTAELVALLGDAYGDAAGSVGADWYEELRADAVPRSMPYTATIAPTPTESQYSSLAGWATQPLYSSAPEYGLALTRLAGGLQRHISSVDRQTILMNVNRDPVRVTHARTASAGACAFCAMLATRGGVYNDESVKFRAHDYCRCQSVPVFGDETLERPSYYDLYQDAYDEAFGIVGRSDTKAILSEMRRILGH